MPLFLAVVFGIIDYGWYFYQRYALVAAVRDGVRYGVTFPSATAAAQAKLQASADVSAPGSPITTAITWGPVGGTGTVSADLAPNKFLTLSASTPFKPLVGFVPVPALVQYTMVMLLENQP